MPPETRRKPASVSAEPLGEADGLGGDDVFERAALQAGEDAAVDVLDELLLAQDEAAARAAQGLVRGGGHEVGVGHGAGVDAAGDEPGDVRHVDHVVGADLVRDFAEAREVDGARIGGGAGQDQARLALQRQALDGVVVQALGRLVHGVGDDGVELAGEVGGGAVAEVAALVQAHGEDGVAGLEDGVVDGHVRGAAAVGLHVRGLGAEERLHALDGQRLHRVHRQAAVVEALARIALGVLVGEDGALGLADGRGGVVLRGDEVDGLVLLADLGHDGGVHLRVGLRQQGGLGQTPRAVAFRQAADMALRAGEGRVQPHAQGAAGGLLVEGARGEDEDVGIVVLAGELRHRLVRHDGRADAHEAVRHDAHANAGGAQQHAARGLPFHHRLAHRDGEIGVVIRRGRVERPHVHHLMAALLQELDKVGLQCHAGVVAPNRNRAHAVLLAKRIRTV